MFKNTKVQGERGDVDLSMLLKYKVSETSAGMYMVTIKNPNVFVGKEWTVTIDE